MHTITVSLELAKELKENGYPQEGHFWYDLNGLNQTYSLVCENELPPNYDYDSCFAAPTASEIGEKLPAEIETKDNYFSLDIQKMHIEDKNKGAWGIAYSNQKMLKGVNPIAIVHDQTFKSFIDKSLAECMGKMALYLLKQGLLPVKE